MPNSTNKAAEKVSEKEEPKAAAKEETTDSPKLTKAKAQEVVNFYNNVSYSKEPAVLKEAREFLEASK